jgi:hypothetical protein
MEPIKRKTKVEIINETVEYYSQDPENRRSVNSSGSCFYFNNSKKCAIGRCMLNPQEQEEKGDVFDLISIDILEFAEEEVDTISNRAILDSLLKEEYRGHEILFWDGLQKLHDFGYNWSKEGLTEIGKSNVKLLLETYKNG